MSSINRRQALKLLGAGVASLPLSYNAFAQTLLPALPNTSGFVASTAEKYLDIISLERLEPLAKEKMAKAAWEFVSGGKEDEWTLRENTRAFDDYALYPRRLQSINPPNTQVNLLGTSLPFPIIVAPMGVHRMVHERGELDTARGAGLANTLYCSSSASNYPLEQIAAATSGPKWWQLYMNSDMKVNESLLRRAKKAGYRAIIFTVDSLGPGTPDAFMALGDGAMRSDMTFANYDPAFGGFGNLKNQKLGIGFDDISTIKKIAKLPVIVKGILRPDDARLAVARGADAIWVSNHGGRTMDGVPASISVLPKISREIGQQVPIILDSGIRRGTDVVRALALGADVVALGRPCLYGLALGGGKGVQSVIEHLHQEMQNVMKLLGVDNITQINQSLITTKHI